MKRITFIGTGYVGLVTGACLAELGNQVICLDIDQNKISALQAGKLPFYEPKLDELVRRNLEANRLHFTTQYEAAIPGCEICFLALPTPAQSDGSCDFSYVEKAAKELARHMDGYLVVVNKSTVPVGSAERVRQIIEKEQQSIPFDLVSNPEFLSEGTAVSDCLKPDRILLGLESERAKGVMLELYAAYQDRLLIMDIRSAELAKYAANAMLATRLSFMNDLSLLCEKLSADVDAVRRAIGSDRRIGSQYLYPGIGFGGSCLPKDVQALRSIAKELGQTTPLLDSILEINERQKEHFFDKIHTYFGSLSGKTLAILGLSFKPNTDDIREAPSLYLLQRCLELGAHLQVYDPVAIPKVEALFGNKLDYCSSPYEAAEGADALIIVTEWKEFSFLDFEQLSVLMRTKALFDGRNLYQADAIEAHGFDYFSIGRASVYAHS